MVLEDSFKRNHNYLRISITERCNLRCTYCMPADGIELSSKEHIMTYEEIYEIAKTFVDNGVDKIRITGGEPLVRKDVAIVLEKLASLPAELSITTNGVLVDRFIPLFKKIGIHKINISLDSLCSLKNLKMTRRDEFDRVFVNIKLLEREGFKVKVNCVLMKGVNDGEIVNFIELTKHLKLHVRFIEFMPFNGNKWDENKLVSLDDVIKRVESSYMKGRLVKLIDEANDTAKNYAIKGYRGTFAVISSVTNPFCDTCNRIRLTADGKLKNCLFSTEESDLLSLFRKGEDIIPIAKKEIFLKKKIRGGMETQEQFKEPKLFSKNRSMTTIGG